MKTIALSQGMHAIVDDADFEWLSGFKWSAAFHHGIWRACRSERIGDGHQKGTMMHRMIMGFPSCTVDHINGDGLDNRRANLRLATDAENKRNMKKPRHGRTSKFKGVRWHRINRKWTAQIRVNRKSHYLGSFTEETEAAKAYDLASKRLHGSFGRQNFPPLNA